MIVFQRSKIIATVAGLFLMFLSFGAAETLTLQQGVNGYSGCMDSWYGARTNGMSWAQDMKENFGKSPHLIVDSDNFSPT